MKSRRSTKNGRPKDMGDFPNAPLDAGGFYDKVMISEFKISTGLGSECDRLKPSVMGQQVKQTSPGVFQDC